MLRTRARTKARAGYEAWADASLLRNPDGIGLTAGVIGAGGAMPTYWGSSINDGLSLNVLGRGQEDGVTYTAYRLSGTTTGAGSSSIFFEAGDQIVAASGQTFSLFCKARVTANDWTNIANGGPRLAMYENTAAGAYVTEGDDGYVAGIAATYVDLDYTYTLVGGGTVARVRPLINFVYGTGLAIGVSFRIAAPRMVRGSVL